MTPMPKFYASRISPTLRAHAGKMGTEGREFNQNKTNELVRLIGPFYDLSAMRELLVVNQQTVFNLTDQGRTISCPLDTSDVYPAWQINNGVVDSGLLEIWNVLILAVDAWTAAAWLASPAASVLNEDTRRIYVVVRDDGPDTIRPFAEEAADVWSR